jgi:hypothetical protein
MSDTGRETKRQPGKPGRKPRVANRGKRVSLGLKVSPEIKNSLDAAAKDSGRTQSQEAEWRLDRSFQQQHLLDQVYDLNYRDPQLVALLLQMGEAMRDTITATTNAIKCPVWANDPWAFDRVARAATFLIDKHRPDPDGEIVAPNASIEADGENIGERIGLNQLQRLTHYNPDPMVTVTYGRTGEATVTSGPEVHPIGPVRAIYERTPRPMLDRLMGRDHGRITMQTAGLPEPDPKSPVWARRRSPRASAKDTDQ